MKVNILLQAACFAAASSLSADTVKFSALVIDDSSGLPIPGVTVRANFAEDIGWRAWTESPRPDVDIKVTGCDGRCSLVGKTNCGDAGCWVSELPQGYYSGRGWGHGYKEKDLFGVWQPDNLVATIRLQRVEHPIPLFVKNVGDHINRSKVGCWNGTNTIFRYDLVKGDYLPPDGSGEVADLVVDSGVSYLETTNVWRESKTFFDIMNTFRFSGKGNGLIPVMTKATDGIRLRRAPADGYAESFSLKCGTRKRPSGVNLFRERYSETDPNRCHYFRIRSKFDEKGNLVAAYYGKIYGDFKISGGLEYGPSVEFLYYLNPKSLDRNLEWDRTTNLCPTAGKHESVQP